MLVSFNAFLIETDDGKLKHLKHLEDDVIDHGSAGYHNAVAHLYSVHDKLKGRRMNRGDAPLSIKKDGAPSVIAGTHPETGKFFVGTKSVFNKTPKINYSHEDIERNHGHAPGLVEKLKTALDNLPKIIPKGRVYQGDMMYTRGDVKSKGKKYSFKPNTIEYSTPKNSDEGKKITKAKMGIAVHTEYSHSGTLGSMRANFNVDLSHLNQHPDVHVVSHHYSFDNPDYEQQHQKAFVHHMKKASAVHASMSESEYNTVTSHSAHLNMYINHKVRTAGNDSLNPGLGLHHEDYHAWLKDRSENHKQPKERASAAAAMKDVSANPSAFNKAFELHHHLTRAKENLIHVMDRRQTFEHKIDGVKTNPEGYVNTVNGNPRKFVKRQEFSAANFGAGKPGA